MQNAQFASGRNSGRHSTAMGGYSTAMGSEATASDADSTAKPAMGSGTTVSGNTSTAMGLGTTASGHFSTAMGSGTTAAGINSTAMGRFTMAESGCETVVGQYNALGDSPSATSWVATDAAFRVGVGTNEDDRKDALTVYKNGNASVMGNFDVKGNLTVSGEQLSALVSRLVRKEAEALQARVAELETQLAAIKSSAGEAGISGAKRGRGEV